MIQHLPAVLIIVGQLAVWTFYALFSWPRCSGNQLRA
jgi:hypothetical protein